MNTSSQQKKDWTNSALVSDWAIGMSDGLIVPFVLAAALSGVLDSSGVVITAVMAETVICSVAMFLGGYQAGKTEMESLNEEKKERTGTLKSIQDTRQNVKEFYAHLGFTGELQEQAAREVIRDKEMWTDIVRQEPSVKSPGSKKAWKTALNIGFSYLLGGLITLSPYFFTKSPLEGLRYTVFLTLPCLFILGWLQSKTTGSTAWAGAIRLTVLGAAAAGSAFFVARLIDF